ncbi:MAG: hypothetical protein IPK26_03635 [Planctomycetes bacterium]|nr:hypothetical protein [Planctomycetota bacterium]
MRLGHRIVGAALVLFAGSAMADGWHLRAIAPLHLQTLALIAAFGLAGFLVTATPGALLQAAFARWRGRAVDERAAQQLHAACWRAWRYTWAIAGLLLVASVAHIGANLHHADRLGPMVTATLLGLAQAIAVAELGLVPLAVLAAPAVRPYPA